MTAIERERTIISEFFCRKFKFFFRNYNHIVNYNGHSSTYIIEDFRSQTMNFVGRIHSRLPVHFHVLRILSDDHVFLFQHKQQNMIASAFKD